MQGSRLWPVVNDSAEKQLQLEAHVGTDKRKSILEGGHFGMSRWVGGEAHIWVYMQTHTSIDLYVALSQRFKIQPQGPPPSLSLSLLLLLSQGIFSALL